MPWRTRRDKNQIRMGYSPINIDGKLVQHGRRLAGSQISRFRCRQRTTGTKIWATRAKFPKTQGLGDGCC
jgi:hypothetical protein